MYSSEVENVIAEYLKNNKAEYAVMIDGDWGSGKTFFLTHSLMRIMETIDIGKDKRRKYAYVSLYGAKSIDEVTKEIFFQCLGKKNKKKFETVETVMETASNILTASGAVNIDLSKFKDTLVKININNWIICFDDLERGCLPINEILGYMNRLVEHNKCKVIVLANEKEIGKMNLNQRLEEKYKVILAGRKILLSKDDKLGTDNKEDEIDFKKLEQETKKLFDEDILYKSVREKVIGLTIRYEPQMDLSYDSIISDYNDGRGFKMYLEKNKSKILKYFEDEDCFNLRTLISALESIEKVYNEMGSQKFDSVKYFDGIMDEFVKYIVLLTIYYRNGGKVSDLRLTTEIGYVSLGQNIFSHTRGFKFLEKYCTTLRFSEDDFIRVVSMLRQEYEEEEKRIAKSKQGLAKAYADLSYWWEEEDDVVEKLITQLNEEVKRDKYPFNSYQGIIGQLMVLKKNGFSVGDIKTLVDVMNQNIEKADEIVDIERFSFTFDNSNPVLQKEYDEYIDKLKLKVGNKNHIIKAAEVSKHLVSENWAKELMEYCEKYMNDFLSRYGFIDLLDIDIFLEKIGHATTKEWYIVRDIFKRVYGASNINEHFLNDKEKIINFRDELNKIEASGINKPMAKKALVDYLDDVIKRLEKEVYRIK